ncbi:ATP synthase subunit I [Marinibactrum halimedae]|uniref:ATP synthase subunit I n=1 Tax=Marinibactrum halimedae TaxID=1444977 RepID=A0AA37WRC6_9GAMM|nr:ATP synthase subunit I [Marinibactrum halimedae]MCD9460009.1 ATP synthase subunit I [Marinibactrum halimedae]GLS28222.1 ATP synthase subunit I [Marinibactrum halimedae]
MVSIKKPPVYRIYQSQLLILLSVGVCTYWLDLVVSYSIVLGGLLNIIPNAYFAYYAFRIMGAKQSENALRMIYRGEIGKFSLTIMGFAIIFVTVKKLHYGALFGAYASCLVLHAWFAQHVISERHR